MDFELTKEQQKAFNRLKAAHKSCIKSGILFYNNYGSLGALDKKKWKSYVDYKKTNDSVKDEMQNIHNEFGLACNEWADDDHYFIPQD